MNQIPEEIHSRILSEIKTKLFPDPKILFLKIFIIHLISALATLSICPQFGFAFFRSQFDIMPYFMKIGPHFCEFACGSFFTASSFLMFMIILKRDEIRFIRYKSPLFVSLIILGSLGFLLMFSPSLFLQLSALWLLGAVFGAAGVLEVGFYILNRQ